MRDGTGHDCRQRDEIERKPKKQGYFMIIPP